MRSVALRALLVSETISTTASQMTWLALPWFVLTTTGSAARMSIVVAAEAAAYAVSQANALFQGATRATLLLGPPLAGILIAAIGAPVVLLVDAASFAIAFALIALSSRRCGRHPSPRTSPASRASWRESAICAATGCSACGRSRSPPGMQPGWWCSSVRPCSSSRTTAASPSWPG
jgi:hypothetical protein